MKSDIVFFFPDGKDLNAKNVPVPRIGEQVFFNCHEMSLEAGWKVVGVQHIYHRFAQPYTSEVHVYLEPDFDLTHCDLIASKE